MHSSIFGCPIVLTGVRAVKQPIHMATMMNLKVKEIDRLKKGLTSIERILFMPPDVARFSAVTDSFSDTRCSCPAEPIALMP
jgi:hypothetical protein